MLERTEATQVLLNLRRQLVIVLATPGAGKQADVPCPVYLAGDCL